MKWLSAPALAVTPALFIDPQRRPIRSLVTGLAISLCVHFAILWFTPAPLKDGEAPGVQTRGPLIVQLSPRSEPALSAAPPPPPTPPAPAPPRRVIATAKPSTEMPPVMPAPEPRPQPETPAPPKPLSFSEAIEARRRELADNDARTNAAESAASRGPSDEERTTANINRNLATLTQQGGTSGVFQITYKGTRTGSFKFRGWRNDPGSGWQQTIEVDAGTGGNIELAMVQKMISLIREHYKENFNWESRKLGRVVVLSARQQDNAGLEQFLLREFFDN